MRRPTSVAAQRPLLGVKRTCLGLVTLSANDLKADICLYPRANKATRRTSPEIWA